MDSRSVRRRTMRATVIVSMTAGLFASASALASHGVTVPISLDPSGTATGNDSSLYTDMTPDGRFVAFVSAASNLVPGDTNNVGDVFVRDRRTGLTERVSLGIRGAEGDGDSNFLGIGTDPSISDDGRYVAFKSEATNLVKGDRNNVTDVFVRDRVAGTTERVSVDNAGNEAAGGGDDPAISPDGRYVAFVTTDFDANFHNDIFMRDRVAGTTVPISVAFDGASTQNGSDGPVVGLGPVVAFSSSADNLVADDGNGSSDVFVRDLTGTTPTTERVSVTSDEQPPVLAIGHGSRSAAISSDGRYVAFSSDAVNFTSRAQTGPFMDIFVRDRIAGTTVLASPDSAGREADGQSEGPDISPDGRYVSFSSFANDLVRSPSDDVSPFLSQDAFVRDRLAGSTELVSVASDHSNATIFGFDTHVGSGPVSADGLLSLLSTNADNLFAGDTLFNDVYANDRRPGTDLSLIKTDAPDPVAPQGTLTYTLTATNNGPNPAPAAGILDTLPADMTFASASSGCTHIAGKVDCALGTLAPGQIAIVTIVVTPRRTGTFTNTATVGSLVADPNLSNNTATTTTTVVK